MWRDRIAFGFASRIISRRALLGPAYPRRRSLSCSGSSAPKWICWRTWVRAMRYLLVLPEKQYLDGHAVQGSMAAVRVVHGGQLLDAFGFNVGGGVLQYYDVDGHLLPRAFLAAPLKFDRISSTFDLARPDPADGCAAAP